VHGCPAGRDSKVFMLFEHLFVCTVGRHMVTSTIPPNFFFFLVLEVTPKALNAESIHRVGTQGATPLLPLHRTYMHTSVSSELPACSPRHHLSTDPPSGTTDALCPLAITSLHPAPDDHSSSFCFWVLAGCIRTLLVQYECRCHLRPCR
jgi:hypothetical protein